MLKDVLKEKFSSGAKPTGEDFAELIETLDATLQLENLGDNVGTLAENQEVIDENVNTLHSNLNEVSKRIETAELNITNVKTTSDGLADKLLGINDEVNYIRENYSSMEEDELQAKISQLQLSVATIEGGVQNLKAYDDTAIVSKVSTIENVLSNIKPYDDTHVVQKVATVETALAKKIESVESFVEEKTVESISLIDQSIQEITAVKSNVQSLEQAVSTVKAETDAISENLGEISEEIKFIKDNYATLTEEELNDRVNQLQLNLATIEGAITNLQTYDDTVISGRVTALETTVAGIKPYDDSSIKQQINNNAINIEAVNNNMSTLEAKVDAVKPYDDTTVKNDIASHILGTKDKHIHSSGENSNGRWIKFEEGTLICYVSKNLTTSADIPYLGQFIGVHTWTYPHEFVSNYVTALAGSFKMGTSASFGTPNNVNKASASYYTMDFQIHLNGSKAVFSAMAIGRWK